MRANPSLRVMITSGYYDLNCPYFGTKLAISQFAPDLGARVNVIYYQSGHRVPPELREAVAKFIRDVLAMSSDR
jgi:carboxypeptidase C (cathepsin A)